MNTPIGGPLSPPGLLNLRGSQEADAAAQAAQAATETQSVDLDRQRVAEALQALGQPAVGQAAAASQPIPLPPLNTEALPENLSSDDLISWAAATFDKTQTKLGEVTMTGIQNQKERLAAVNADKLEKIKDAQRKAEEAEPGFWGKAFGWLSNIATAVVAAVSVVVGVVACATGVGALVGVALIAMGTYMMAGAVVDMVEDVRKEMGLPPLGWSPTLGQLAACIAKAVGASEEVQSYIKMGVDLVTDIAIGICTGALVIKAVSLIAKVASSASKLVNMQSTVRKATIGTETVDAGASIGRGLIGVDTAINANEAAKAKAEVKTMVALLAKMQAMFELMSDELKSILERQADGLKRCSDMVADRGAAQAQLMTTQMA